MATESPESRLASLYNLLFSMHGHIIWILLIVTSSLLTSYLLLDSINVYFLIIFIGLCALTIGINIVIRNVISEKEPLLNLRRLNIASGFLTISTLIAVSIGRLLSHMTGIEKLVLSFALAGLSYGFYLSLIMQQALTLKPFMPYTIIQPLALGLLLLFITNFTFNSLAIYSVLYLTSFALAIITVNMINKIENTFSHDQIKLTRLCGFFLMSMLESYNKPLEREMLKLSENIAPVFDIVTIREIRNNEPILALIVSGVHLGPFKNFGSSILPNLIENRLRALGLRGIVVKGLAKTSWNIIGEEDLERISVTITREVKSMIQGASRYVSYSDKIAEPAIVTNNGVKITMLSFSPSRFKLMSITLHPNPMEDIPPEVISEEVVNNYEDKCIIDCHNCFSQEVKELSKDDVKQISDILKSYANGRCSGKFYDFNVGFSRKMPDEWGMKEGIGPGGISAICIGYNDKKLAFVIVDSNNAVREVRDLLVNVSKELGINVCELITTDTHTVNGLIMGVKSYYPFGERIDLTEIQRYFKSVLMDAMKDMKPAEIAHKRLKVDPVRVFSARFLDDLYSAIIQGVRRIKFSLALTAFSLLQLAYLLSILS